MKFLLDIRNWNSPSFYETNVKDLKCLIGLSNNLI